MIAQISRGLAVIAFCLCPTLFAQEGVETSGRVFDRLGQPITRGWVGLIFESTLDRYGPEERVWPDRLAELDGFGRYRHEFTEDSIRGRRFYLFSLAPRHENRIFGSALPSPGLPTPRDFQRAGVRRLNDAVDNRPIDFQLESNRTSVIVPMRDGVTRLATDVFRPVTGRPLPTIVVRTPYGKSDSVRATWLTLFGYAVVIQDMRGRFQSNGEDAYFRASAWGEHQDGWDTIEWAARQPFSNGRVGSWGSSALAIVQYLTAGAAPPSLRACFAIAGTGDLYDDLTFPGGLFREAAVEGWLDSIGRRDFLSEIEAHPTPDAWWDLLQLDRRLPSVQVPIYHVGGWFDFMLPGALGTFQDLRESGGGPAPGGQKLVIGPWTHGGFFTDQQGQLSFPARLSDLDVVIEAVRYFDYWLLDQPTGVASEPPVKYFVLGDAEDPDAPGNEWRTAETWPVPATPINAYLTGKGGLSLNRPPAGGKQRMRTFRYDPADPVPTVGGSNFVLPSGAYDQRPIEARADVLTYTSEILDAPLEVTGPLRARLFVSSTARDTDFVVKLLDVYPDGRSMLIQEGALRARYRGGMNQERFLVPGQVSELEIDVSAISIVFNRGHRIRISITSSNHPRYDVNPNTGEPFRQHTQMVPALNTIHCSERWPSHLVLPVRF